MNYTQGEIIAALKLIQNICDEQGDCNLCPFRTKDNRPEPCTFCCNTPNHWCIKNDEESWRAFQ